MGWVLNSTIRASVVALSSHTYLCERSDGGMVIDEESDSGPRAHWTTGLNTGSWSVNVLPRFDAAGNAIDFVGSTPWLQAVRAGLFSEATVRVDRGYVLAWPTSNV